MKTCQLTLNLNHKYNTGGLLQKLKQYTRKQINLKTKCRMFITCGILFVYQTKL
jgi:hypothetical protein